MNRTTARLLVVPASAGVALLALAAPASAHVTITPGTTAAGSYTVLTVSVPHGCEGSATTKVAIRVPEELLSVTPTRNPLWEVTKTKQKLAAIVKDAHGNEVTERDAVVTYTARSPLPDGYRDAFELSVKLPDKVGETLVFPTVQTCEKGQTAWTEVAADGDAEELEHPAPLVTTTAAEPGESVPEAEDKDDEDSDTLGPLGLGAGVLGLVAGVAALVLVRRKP